MTKKLMNVDRSTPNNLCAIKMFFRSISAFKMVKITIIAVVGYFSFARKSIQSRSEETRCFLQHFGRVQS